MKLIKPGFAIITPLEWILEYDKIIERCGRKCYQSQHKIEDGSAEKFVEMIQNRNHESVIEHCTITVEFICDRGVSHEVVRHRIGSYSQESTRYCNYSGDKFNNEITCIDMACAFALQKETKHWAPEKTQVALNEIIRAFIHAEDSYLNLIGIGVPAELARNVLPTGLKTDISITFNLREWKHFFSLRAADAAHPSMREIVLELHKEFKALMPSVFK